MEPIFVYISCKDIKQARKIAGHCVSERLAACGNILPTMESVYWWEGDINHEDETVLILKTMQSKYKELEKAIKLLHSYDCPCVVALPITDGSRSYLDWINTETNS